MASRFLFVIVGVVSISCGARVEDAPRTASHTTSESSAEPESDVIVPPSPGDRTIRREFNLAIGRDSTLKERDISFIVSHGDISLSGVVRSEAERQRINSLALGIPGVKSVANSLRVSGTD